MPKKNGWRIDVENRSPGVSPGNLHLQIQGDNNKYYFNPVTESFYIVNSVSGGFEAVSSSQNKKLLKMSGVLEGIKKALYYLGE